MLHILNENHNISNLVDLTNNTAPLNVLYFTASWCGPCKKISPHVETLSNEYPKVNFYKIDVDEFEDLTSEASVNCMPTFLVYKNNQKVGTMEGADENKLTNLVKNNL